MESTFKPRHRSPAGIQNDLARLGRQHLVKSELCRGVFAGAPLGTGPPLDIGVAGRQEEQIATFPRTNHNDRIRELDTSQVEKARALAKGTDIAVPTIVARPPHHYHALANALEKSPSTILVDFLGLQFRSVVTASHVL